MSLSGECPMRTGIKSRLVSIFYSARCDGTDLAYFTVRKVTSNVWETKCQSRNYLIPRQNCKKIRCTIGLINTNRENSKRFIF